MDANDSTAQTTFTQGQKAADGPDVATVFKRVEDREWECLFWTVEGEWTGVFSSVAYGKLFPWQGKDRLAALTLFELDPSVITVELLPEKVGIVSKGKRFWSTPMFRLTRSSGVSVVDSLRSDQIGNPSERLNWPTAALRDAYASIGIPYQAILKSTLTAQPRLRNAQAVIDGQAAVPSVAAMEAIAAVLAQPGKHSIQTVALALPDLAEVKETVYAMATHHWVKLGLWAKTPETMPVTLLPPGEHTRRQPTGRPRVKSTAVFGVPPTVGIHWSDIVGDLPDLDLIDWTGFMDAPRAYRR